MPLLSIRELSAGGLTRADIDARLAAGSLIRVARGYYAEAPGNAYQAQHLLQVIAYADRCPSDAVISHQSAAVLHGLPLPSGVIGPVRAIRPQRSDGGGGQRTGEVQCRRMPLLAEEVTRLRVEYRDVAVTNIARTVADLACGSLPWGLVAADAALRQGSSREDLFQVVNRMFGRTGVARARLVASLADAAAESPAESLSRAHLHLAALPAPVLQLPIHDERGRLLARCDFGWPKYRVIGECDGLAKYQDERSGTPREVLRREKQRQEAIRDQGWEVVRWMYHEIADPQGMVLRLARALARNGWRRSGSPHSHDGIA